MTWPAIEFGHTAHATAFLQGDVYGVKLDPQRAAKRPLRLGIAGAGGVAQAKWIPAIRRLQTMGEPVNVSGVCDPDEAARAKAAILAGAPAFPSLKALAEKERPDVVFVLTSDAAHRAIAKEAIDLGVPVLVEKPLCRNADEAWALVRHARERGVLLAYVANKRFSPPYRMAKALIESGALKAAPNIFTGKFTLGYPYVDLLEGGTVHLLDLMGWFMGPTTKLFARGLRGEDGRLTSAVVSFSFASGAIGSVMTSADGLSFKPWERVEIFGRNAFLVVDDQIETALYDDENGPAKLWRPSVPNTLMFDETFGGYVGIAENVLDAVRGLAPLEARGADGARAVDLIKAIGRSLDAGVEVEVPPGED
jgi:predicted dehydrogenase